MAQLRPQIEDWKISLQFLPTAFSRDQPVISSAARLNEVMVQLRSTVKTPSATESSISSFCSRKVLSLKVSTPPITSLRWSRKGAALTLTGMEKPSLPMMKVS